MKFLRLIIISAILLWINALSVFAINTQTNPQSIVSLLTINNDALFDIEIIVETDGQTYLPFKYIADILEVEYSQNHLTKEIEVTSDASQCKITPQSNKITINNKTMVSKKLIRYLKEGLMDETIDEVFINSDIAANIFKTKINIDKNDLSIYINTNKELAILSKDEPLPKESSTHKTLKAYTQVIMPQQKKDISFDTIELNNSTRTDSVTDVYLTKQNKNIIFNNSSLVALRGKAYKGDYKLDFSTYANKDRFFSFGGIGFNYKNSYKGYDYELAKISGWDGGIGTNVLGIQVDNFDDKISSFKDIKGTVEPESTVDVKINDKYVSSLSTYGGYYDLEEIHFNSNEPIKTVSIEEKKEDGTIKEIFTKKFPMHKDLLLKGEKKYGVITGLNGYNSKLWSQNGYIYENNAKKALLAARVKYGISENLTSDLLISKDSIVSSGNNDILGLGYLNNNSYLNFGSYRNTNTISGQTISNTLKYHINENSNLASMVGFSNINDISEFDRDGVGLGCDAFYNYKKNRLSLNAGIYNYDSNYYVAGSSSSSIMDKRGAALSGHYSFKNINLNGKVAKYDSNLDNYMGNGVIGFKEYSFGVGAPLTRTSKVHFYMNSKNGENNLGEINSTNYNMNVTKRFGKNLNFEAGRQSNVYDSQYKSPERLKDNYESEFETSYTKLAYTLPKGLGELELSNDIIKADSGSYLNKYNVARIGYKLPIIKGVICSLNTGYRYKGNSNGMDLSATLGYRFKSGRIISLNYQYNRSLGYLLDDMFVPTNSRHSININFNDVFALMSDGLKSVNLKNDDNGFIQAIAYLDANKNGVRDEDEPGIKDVAFKTDWQNESIYTNKKGHSKIQSVTEGIYNLKVDIENLPLLLTVSPKSKDKLMIKVDKNNRTKAQFGFISSVGNIEGVVEIKDEFGRDIEVDELVVCVYDSQGKEIAYSTVDDKNKYTFSGLSPGEYTIMVDEEYMGFYSIAGKGDLGIQKIFVPSVYDKYIDIDGVNLFYTRDFGNDTL